MSIDTSCLWDSLKGEERGFYRRSNWFAKWQGNFQDVRVKFDDSLSTAVSTPDSGTAFQRIPDAFARTFVQLIFRQCFAGFHEITLRTRSRALHWTWQPLSDAKCEKHMGRSRDEVGRGIFTVANRESRWKLTRVLAKAKIFRLNKLQGCFNKIHAPLCRVISEGAGECTRVSGARIVSWKYLYTLAFGTSYKPDVIFIPRCNATWKPAYLPSIAVQKGNVPSRNVDVRRLIDSTWCVPRLGPSVV